jgi:hypothetical protein
LIDIKEPDFPRQARPAKTERHPSGAPTRPGGSPGIEPGFEALFCMHLAKDGMRLSTYPDACVCFPSSERSSPKSSCRQVNEGSGPLQPLYLRGKIPDGNAIAAACAASVPAARVVNSRVGNIFNGL